MSQSLMRSQWHGPPLAGGSGWPPWLPAPPPPPTQAAPGPQVQPPPAPAASTALDPFSKASIASRPWPRTALARLQEIEDPGSSNYSATEAPSTISAPSTVAATDDAVSSAATDDGDRSAATDDGDRSAATDDGDRQKDLMEQHGATAKCAAPGKGKGTVRDRGAPGATAKFRAKARTWPPLAARSHPSR